MKLGGAHAPGAPPVPTPMQLYVGKMMTDRHLCVLLAFQELVYWFMLAAACRSVNA